MTLDAHGIGVRVGVLNRISITADHPSNGTYEPRRVGILGHLERVVWGRPSLVGTSFAGRRKTGSTTCRESHHVQTLSRSGLYGPGPRSWLGARAGAGEGFGYWDCAGLPSLRWPRAERSADSHSWGRKGRLSDPFASRAPRLWERSGCTDLHGLTEQGSGILDGKQPFAGGTAGGSRAIALRSPQSPRTGASRPPTEPRCEAIRDSNWTKRSQVVRKASRSLLNSPSWAPVRP
jgi:hypothetical protein